LAALRIFLAVMEAQAIAPAIYAWNDATFHAGIAVAGALASIPTNKDFRTMSRPCVVMGDLLSGIKKP